MKPFLGAGVISYVNTVAKACHFTAVFSQLAIFTADCLRHPIQVASIETIWELHTLRYIHKYKSNFASATQVD